jgi:NAD(P)-dependent dehydrogenase (short-subunit alcohol dehydrogenase family)
MKKTVLVTGADRGLGFATAKEFLEKGYRVFAGRFLLNWNELDDLKQQYPSDLTIIPLDVSDTHSVQTAYAMISKEIDCLDMLINNAGISGSAGDIYNLHGLDGGCTIFNVNCLGVLRMVHTFLPLMESVNSDKRLCFVSSEAGSISVCHRTEGFIYPMTKTALNMAVRMLHNELYAKGYTFRLFHPGWVRSYMSGKKNVDGQFEPEESAASAVRYYTEELLHEDVLRMIDNEFVTWPF